MSEYLDFKNGLNPSAKSFGEGIKFISVMDILNNPFITYDCIRASVAATDKEKEEFCVECGDILFQRSSETLEDVGHANVYLDNRPALFGGFTIRGKKKGEYNPLFFKYLLDSPSARKRVIVKGAGAQHFNIGQEGLSSVSLFFPAMQEQNKIAELLELLDQRIAIQNKVIEDLKMLKATLSRKLLWDNPLLSKRVQLSNFGTLKNGYAFKSSEYIPESEFRIVTIANVTGEREISIKNCNTIHSLPRDIQEHQKLKPNDILVSLTGNVGRVSLCNLDGCLLNQRVGLLVLNDDYLHEYIFQVLSDIRFLQSMITSGQGAAQMNIGKYDVESFFIPFSEDLNLLNKIADMLYSIDLRITQSMKDLLLIRKQKHYFLSNLFI